MKENHDCIPVMAILIFLKPNDPELNPSPRKPNWAASEIPQLKPLKASESRYPVDVAVLLWGSCATCLQSSSRRNQIYVPSSRFYSSKNVPWDRGMELIKPNNWRLWARNRRISPTCGYYPTKRNDTNKTLVDRNQKAEGDMNHLMISTS